jgi:hypothetical protein
MILMVMEPLIFSLEAGAVPNEYGVMPRSYLLRNDGKGKFTDVTEQYSVDLSKVGFVKHATWNDMDNDGDKDLVLSLEWDGIVAFVNDNSPPI